MSSLSQIRILNITEDLGVGTDQVATVDQLSSVGNTIGAQAFVEETNRLYIWNGSGWYNIALINTTPTWDSGGQPAVAYELDADSPQDATVITLAASDPEGLPISYNYITSGQMDSIATISQDSSVFTITPKTSVQAPDGGTGSITFRATDGINILPQVSSFTLTFSSIVENNRYTTLLATATDTSDNNNITDASSNNHTITVNGDAYAGTFSPYRSGGYSTYFTGSAGDNLKVENQSGNWSDTGTVTIEFWFYSTRTPSTDEGDGLGAFFTPNVQAVTATRFDIENSSNDLEFRSFSDAAGNGFQTVTIKSALTPHNWYHLAAVKNGQVWKFYVNGVLEHTHTQSTTYNWSGYGSGNYNKHFIGQTRDAVSFQGYITDIRVSSNQAYTTAFTAPAERLEADSNTTFFYSGTGYIGDTHSSTASNNESITVSGNVSTKPFSPYDYEEYDATDHGGSVHFDGTGDGLVTSAIIPATGNFTIEGWVYSTSTDSSQVICGQRTNSGSGRFALEVNAGNIKFFQNGAGSGHTTSNLEALNKWCHFVLMRTSNNLALYVNGERKLNTTSGTFEQTNFEVGTDVELDSLGLNYGLYGFVSDLQVSLSAKYSEGTSVTVPTAPLSSSGTALHIKGTDASIIDKSQGSNIKLIGNTTGTSVLTGSSTPPYIGSGWAGKSVINLGSTSENYRVEALSKDDNGIGFPDLFNGECTVEFWMRSLTLARQDIWAFGNTSRNNIYLRQEHDNRIRLTVINSFGSAEFNQESTATISQNTWHHVCFMCNGSSVAAVYLDGTKILPASGTHVNLTSFVPDTSDSNVKFVLGNNPFNGNLVWGGYISDFRVTTNNVYGNPQTTASFTPPTASLEG